MRSLLLRAQEFVSAALNQSLLQKKDLLQSAFKHFDCDQDGVISNADLSAVRARGPDLAQQRMRHALMHRATAAALLSLWSRPILC